jgi:thiol:disulfide interchange protein DsbD
LRRSLATLFFIAASGVSMGAWAQAAVGSEAKAVVTTEQVRAELMVYAPDGVAPGKPLWAGLQLTHKPEWHTYWKNSGDSGLPTSVQWTLPAGITAADIAWPVPKKIPLGTLANYGYDNVVLLPVPLTVGPDFKSPVLGNSVDIKLKANWLVCRKECIPGEGEFALKLPVQGSTALNRPAFDAALAAQPVVFKGDSQIAIDGDALKLTVSGLPASAQGKTLEFFPETAEVIETAAAWTQKWDGANWSARIPLSAQRSQSPSLMPLVLGFDDNGKRAGLRLETQVSGAWPKLAGNGAAEVSPALQTALAANASAATLPPSLLAALLGALLGGLILNLMPCVFPVLAIKVMSFTHHADDKHAHRVSGVAYTAGVLLSFTALGGLMLALRAAGDQLGWGFQLQSPAVVAVLAVLFTVMGLNLAGLFEFGMVLPSRLCSAQAKHPAMNSFISGVVAVAVASPCTAPFMGASLGLAVSLPAVQALAVFAAIGLGMALPYLVASFTPALARALPRPGAWMLTFRHFMAFPMFATVVWLLWVLGQQTGIDGAAALLALLVALAMVVWAFTLKGRARVVIAGLSLAALAGLGFGIGQRVLQVLPAGPVGGAVAAGERWQPWEPGRVEQTLASGQPVFVDFTAAWCVTCQYNKKTTLADAGVLADIAAKKVQLLRADWTRHDPAISAALGQLGRSGVPAYVLYQAGRPPVVLSEILSVSEVRTALAAL